ncbi:hypothetical protein [Halomonas binhaiensis]|uniref:Uncharacterized protein n=1 Tax=Halomonas binhaiensis TaxID=2562282 RepID=A0A5C1NDR5_9GAMM|nr:hypothetical protein [Halomonas binhaiensis]QEM80197.1 hypothetical protein E4T21_00475 [Halomonas binhaiensis]
MQKEIWLKRIAGALLVALTGYWLILSVLFGAWSLFNLGATFVDRGIANAIAKLYELVPFTPLFDPLIIPLNLHRIFSVDNIYPLVVYLAFLFGLRLIGLANNLAYRAKKSRENGGHGEQHITWINSSSRNDASRSSENHRAKRRGIKWAYIVPAAIVITGMAWDVISGVLSTLLSNYLGIG